MIKLQMRYKTEEGKAKILEMLSTGVTIKKISDPYKSGQYYRIYLDVE